MEDLSINEKSILNVIRAILDSKEIPDSAKLGFISGIITLRNIALTLESELIPASGASKSGA